MWSVLRATEEKTPFFLEHFRLHFLIGSDVQLSIQLGLTEEALNGLAVKEGSCPEGLWEFKVGAHVAFQGNIMRSR